jgi:hypothetical protein
VTSRWKKIQPSSLFVSLRVMSFPIYGIFSYSNKFNEMYIN